MMSIIIDNVTLISRFKMSLSADLSKEKGGELFFESGSEECRFGKNRIDFPQQFLNLSASLRHVFTAFSFTSSVQFFLLFLRQLQHCAQPFVINDAALINTGQFVEDLISERPVTVAKCNRAIRKVESHDFLASNARVFFRRLNQIKHFIVLKRQGF